MLLLYTAANNESVRHMPTKDEVSAIVSTFRTQYTVFQLECIQRVTGKSFGISGDAPLRFKAKMEHSATYGKTDNA